MAVKRAELMRVWAEEAILASGEKDAKDKEKAVVLVVDEKADETAPAEAPKEAREPKPKKEVSFPLLCLL